ncbi:hypothetical protein TGAM01_v207469 [Trichoderma gamsii]|uniref:Uncharacterized protein n=1 Tax=Trichoderma gamsii TaxID=398673 RepID=A0A2P4ZHR9_9HYPO|nr:hypothetical protein TGAM01_v207469 [Trichoderma gamsii]PON23822.1 hypothetical protein TGAM01_v207469 [Trichoderma gamsii]
MSIAGTTSVPSETQYKICHRPTYASFGENGLTATATAYGHLLQITQYFGNDPSGFYCVDLKDVLEPCWVTQRMEQLQAHIVDPGQGMRLEVESFDNSKQTNEMPRLSFHSNRWPKFIIRSGAGSIDTEIQYFIHQKTVCQTYTFISRGDSSASLPELAINAELLIRDLDFSSSSIWNMQEADNSSYEHRAPQGKHCILRMHKTGIEQNSDANEPAHNNAVVLAIWPFMNDSLSDCSTIGNYCEISYTLHFVPLSQLDDIPSPSPPMKLLRRLNTDAERNEVLSANPFLPGDENLDYALKRNLEHMLSVCSVSIGDNTEGTIQPIAITCGDLAGHRVANEASFCQMRSRIWKVCRGHLKWITDQMETNAGLVHSQYWATGRPRGAEPGSPFLQKSLMETPFHIIKIAEFCRTAEDREAWDEVQRKPKFIEIIRKWVETLDGENKHGLYAFPRPRKEAPIHSFYFPDQAIIWWATKSVEYLGLGQELQVERSACVAKHKPRNMSYSSDEIRANAIKKYTTENPVLKKRMIAISRNTIETRFLIREKETVLFSALDLGLLDKFLSPLKSGGSEKINAWTNTIDCQAQHEDNQDTQWDHPLQFALAIILASNGARINSKPAAEMMHYSKSALLGSSSLNGLFPGQLNEDKEPIIFMKDTMCDSYWHVTFEVPYLLWKHAKASSTNAAETGSSSISTIQAQFTKQENPCMTSKELDQALDKMFERLSAAFFTPGLSTINGKLAIKKSVPFKSIIDQNNIVELQDEWMYNEPTFFNFNCNLSKHCNLGGFVLDDEVLTTSEKETFHRVGNVMANAINLIKQDGDFLIAGSPIAGYIIDVPRGSPANKEYKKPFITSNPEIYGFDGDYFDRYWTCHFFEFNTKDLPETDWELRRVTNKDFGAISKANPWRQRRVLELFIVSTMLQEILLSSQTILEEFKKSIQNSVNRKYIGQQPPASALLDTFDLFTKIDNGRFVAISRLWYKFQHILQIVENDLRENLAKIALWNDRERARGHDKPRWTKSDERDYRPIISKLQAHNDHKYHELQRCYVNIASFNASLSTNLDKMRGDLELRGADDIRLFTYVTVIFLPVGFATGIFSMSDAPSTHTLICMVITAAVALLVTVIALTNAKTLDNKIVGPILRGSRRALYSSVGRPLKIIYSALKIQSRPCIYYFARYIYFPFMNKYTGSGLAMEIMEEIGMELFEMADNTSPWEHAYEDFLKTINEMPPKKREYEEQDWGDSIGRYTNSIPQRMSVRFRGSNNTTVKTDSAV